jgi:hypothetical protein
MIRDLDQERKSRAKAKPKYEKVMCTVEQVDNGWIFVWAAIHGPEGREEHIQGLDVFTDLAGLKARVDGFLGPA